MLLRDALDRRWRDTPQPTGKRVYLRGRRLIWAQMLHWHGPLPSSILHEFTKHLSADEVWTRKQLRDLFHEDNTPHGGAYFTRPQAQKGTEADERNQKVYDLLPAAERALKEAGLWSDLAPKRTSSWLHDFFSACNTASIHLACLREPEQYGYIPHHEIVARVGRQSFEVPGFERHLRPDPFLGITYKGHGTIIALTESDLATERHTLTEKARKAKRKTYEESMALHYQFVEKRQYRAVFGEKVEMMTLHFFNSEGDMAEAMELMGKAAPHGAKRQLFKYVPGFKRYEFKPPYPLYSHFDEPWLRVGQPPRLISQP